MNIFWEMDTLFWEMNIKHIYLKVTYGTSLKVAAEYCVQNVEKLFLVRNSWVEVICKVKSNLSNL